MNILAQAIDELFSIAAALNLDEEPEAEAVVLLAASTLVQLSEEEYE